MKPLNKKLFGALATAGQQIQVSAWVPGDSQARLGSIVKQKSTHGYIVDTTLAGGAIGRCSLVNTTAAAAGQMTVKVFPFGAPEGSGATLGSVHMRVKTIAVNFGGTTGYTTGDIITVTGGTGTKATATVTANAGVITGLALLNPGDYTVLSATTAAATTVAPAGGDNTATVNVTFEVLSVGVTAGGLDYNAVTITFGAGAATATGTVVGGAVTDVVLVNRGSYTTIPTVALAVVSTAVVEYASKIATHLVYTFLDNVYKWLPQGNAIVAGQANIETA